MQNTALPSRSIVDDVAALLDAWHWLEWNRFCDADGYRIPLGRAEDLIGLTRDVEGQLAIAARRVPMLRWFSVLPWESVTIFQDSLRMRCPPIDTARLSGLPSQAPSWSLRLDAVPAVCALLADTDVVMVGEFDDKSIYTTQIVRCLHAASHHQPLRDAV